MKALGLVPNQPQLKCSQHNDRDVLVDKRAGEEMGNSLLRLVNPNIRPFFGYVSNHIESWWFAALFIPPATPAHMMKRAISR